MNHNDKELTEAVVRFLHCVDLVFDYDWEFSKNVLTGTSLEHFIAESGTFLSPEVRDESNNWANRGSFLSAYRDLTSILEKRGMKFRVSDEYGG